MSDAATAILAEVASGLAGGLEQFSGAIVDQYEAEMTGGGAVSKEDAAVWVLAVLNTVVRRLQDPRLPAAHEQQVIEELTRDRTARGFPVESLLRAFQVGARALFRVIDEQAGGAGTDARTLLDIHDFCWEWANYAMNVVAAAHHELAVENARRDSSQRAEFVRSVLNGRIPEGRLAAEARLYGLAPQAAYFTFRARPESEQDSQRIELQLARSGSTTTQRAIVVVLEGDVVGLAPQKPRVDDVLVAIGPAQPLTDASKSFAEAGEALEAAAAFGLKQTVDLQSLGPLPLALADDRAAERLMKTHLSTLADQDRSGELEQTTLALLDRDQDVKATAAALHVHPNTVRYRLARFTELTGLDLRRTDDLITTWWLLKRRQAVSRSASAV